MIDIYFTKSVLLWISFIIFSLTISKDSDTTIIISTSVLALANNITSLCDKNFQEGDRFFKFVKYLVRSQFILLIVMLLLMFKLESFLAVDYVKIIIKIIVSILLFVGTVILSILIGKIDTKEDLKARQDSKRIIRNSNDDYIEHMEERENYYKRKQIDYIAKNSFKKGRKK